MTSPERSADQSQSARASHWQRRLTELARQHRVPGASLGILRVPADGRPDDLIQAACGYANFPAGIEATTDTLFQIGSVTKVWTATLALQLADEGKLDLDAPVADVLPGLALADADTERRVTMRHLLTHTSGIDGDVFDDTGRGDDCLAKYVTGLASTRQIFPLGATWSYCNSGFVLAGRVIEQLTGLTWDAAVRQRISEPLGLTHTVTLAEEALLFRTAAGHVDVSADPVLAPVWQPPRSVGPAGLICSTTADVLTFARMHLAGGTAADGTRILSAASAAAMTAHQAGLPGRQSLGDSWGLGWIRFDWDGQRLVGHDGGTIGQDAFLRVLPDPDHPGAGLAVALLTNGGHTGELYDELFREIFTAEAGITMPAPAAPPAVPVDADITPHLGRYERTGLLVEILDGTEKTAGPAIRTTATGSLAELLPDSAEEDALTPVSPNRWLARRPGEQSWSAITFYALPTGQRYLQLGGRATPKT